MPSASRRTPRPSERSREGSTSSSAEVRFPLLERLVAPMGAEAFLADRWGKRAVRVAGAAPRIEELTLDDGWLEQSAEIDAATVDARGRQQQVRVDLAQTPALYASGFTICADVSR